MNICIFVHGTNGSGKSTLARRIINLCGGVSAYYADTSYKGGSTILKNGVGLLGKYDNACGGMDGFHPAASVKDELKKHAMNPEGKVFAEGLMTFGVETCKEISEMFDRCIFILLDTEIPQCIEHVKQRRFEKGNIKEYSPEHLYKKAKSAYSWYLNLLQEGLECYRLKFDDALQCVKYYFNLEERMNIVIEGCDGTGKSTIAKHLCERFGLQYWHESQPRNFTEYRQMLEYGGFVFDRFCFGQFVYNTPEQRKLSPEELEFLVKEVFPATNTVFLYVDSHTDTIIKRLIERGEGSEKIRSQMEKYIKNIRGTYRSVLRKSGAAYIEINGEGGANYVK